MTSLELAREIAKVLDSKKAKGIKVLEIKQLSTLGDYFVIASGTSNTQVKSLADEVEFQIKQKHEIMPDRVEGHQNAQWILIDYDEVMVHLFCGETRDFYNLERLWNDAPETDISDILTQD
ncbi:MAG: ribosome silencing factor [Oscillospiraceae bacterium]|nr:ribosome silencing factor [Oscillospiraceae bacterium]